MRLGYADLRELNFNSWVLRWGNGSVTDVVMNFFQSIRTCFRKYFDFSGRAMRSEFWWFQLFLVVVPLVMMAIDNLLLGYSWDNTITPFAFGADALTAIPMAAVTSRRLHDINLSGWWQLPVFGSYIFYLEPFFPSLTSGLISNVVLVVVGIYTLGLLFMLIRDSQAQTNQYGPIPKAEGQADVFM